MAKRLLLLLERDTVFDYHHYYLTEHEALRVAAGLAMLMLVSPGRQIWESTSR